MGPYEVTATGMHRSQRDVSAEATHAVEIDTALSEGGPFRPVWLDRFVGWWADAVEALGLGAAVEGDTAARSPAPRGCLG